MSVVLISPPVAKACEPLLGIATLSAWLRAHDVECLCIDANAEAQEWLLQVDRVDAAVESLASANVPGVTRLVRSWPTIRGQLERIKASLRSPEAYRDPNRHRTAVTSLNRVARIVGAAHGRAHGTSIVASLSDYLDEGLCDMDSRQVAAATRDPERSLFYEYFARDLIPRVVAARPKVIGVSLIFRNQLVCGMVLAAMLRRACPEAHVTVGGELVSAWVDHLDETALPELVDSIIPYEGEHALLALARGEAVEAVPNLCWRDAGGRLHRNPTRKVAHLDEVPAPDYSWAPWHLYFAPRRTAPMVTARGCYWNRCTFCPEVVNPETRLRLARVDRIVQDMDALYERHGVTAFHFIDSAMPPRTLKGIAEHVAASGRPYIWYGFSRLEPHLFRPGWAQTLAAGGCRMLKLGLETASQRLLDAMDKNQDVTDVSRVLRSLRAAGVGVHAFLMFGTPLETQADAEQTLRFVAEHADCIQFANHAIMNLAKGSPMALDPPAHGIRRVIGFEIPGARLDLALYDNFEGTGWGRLAARRFLHSRFLKHPRIRPIHLRTPASFDSNHSMFFHDQRIR